MNKNIILTTTDILQDYKITEYEGYIEASSTIGSGFFTEFLSSWTDTFGTRSNVIENKLHIIKQDVIRKLQEQAIKKHCNAIVGLQIDVDEISSNQKMIFMVTACGTAVKCEKQNDARTGLRVSGDYLHKKISRSKEYIHEIEAIEQELLADEAANPKMFDTFIEKIIDEDYYEFIEYAFIKLLLTVATCRPGSNMLNENVIEVLNNFDATRTSRAFLDITLTISENKEQILQLRKITSYSYLCSYFSSLIPLSLLLEYLSKGNDYFTVIITYPLLIEYKDYYDNEDIQHIQEIMRKMKECYWNENISITSLKQTSRICECGAVIDGSAPCSCGSTQSISYQTYHDKLSVLHHLDNLQHELTQIFAMQNK